MKLLFCFLLDIMVEECTDMCDQVIDGSGESALVNRSNGEGMYGS